MTSTSFSGRPAASRSSIAAVAAIHVALGYGLVTGLDIGEVFAPPPEKPPLVVKLKQLPPPPEPQPRIPADPVKIDPTPPVFNIPVPPVPPQPLPPTGPVISKSSWTMPLPTDPGPVEFTRTADPVPPVPTPAARTGSRPRSGNLITADDYPEASRRLNEEGLVEVRFTVNADGRVTDCAVERSSGHPRLDAATCARIEARFRFDPAREDGRAVSEVRTQRVNWALRG